ncbi:MAG TPA: UvrD-helicase domain-containing protein [Actinospica sp.]|jgi:hypothetical protein|nr:UvrD-helicase domain-containing protein [Actinospica sp.]
MNARLSVHHRADDEIYRLERSVKADFYDFCHRFRDNPNHPGLHFKQLKGDGRIFSARVGREFRAVLTRAGTAANGQEDWLVLAVRPRKEVYDQLSVMVNRVTGEIEFVDLSVVGDSALRRAGISLTASEPDEHADTAAPAPPASLAQTSDPAPPLLTGYTEEDLRGLGVAEALIPLALTITAEHELDALIEHAPLLSKDVLCAIVAGYSFDEIRREITEPVAVEENVDQQDFAAALQRTVVTTADEALAAAIEEGDFRAWKVFLHPTQRALVSKDFSGPARVSGGPGTGKTIVALHRVRYLAELLPAGADKPILLTTYTKNLTADLRARLASLLEPEHLARVEIAHIDQLANRVAGENTPSGRARKRIDDQAARDELPALLLELGEDAWTAQFLFEEWEQVVLGQSIQTRAEYFRARRAGRGTALTRPQRDEVWKLLEKFTARLDKAGLETWAQAAERAARYELERAAQAESYLSGSVAKPDERPLTDSSARRRTYRFKHVVVDEAQDLRAAHWKMLRAMVRPGPNDMFIAGDTHQRIYDNQVSLGSVGINIRGRSSRLTLSYRTTKEILAAALTVVSGESFDDLDDGSDDLAGYRSVLHGPKPTYTSYPTWDAELAGLTGTLRRWLGGDAGEGGKISRRGPFAVCVADREKAAEVIRCLADQGISCTELTKDGPAADADVHVGTMHRFKGLEYQKLAIVAVSEGVVPRAGLEYLAEADPQRYARECRKARSLLFVAETRARDELAVSWSGRPSRFLPEGLAT